MSTGENQSNLRPEWVTWVTVVSYVHGDKQKPPRVVNGDHVATYQVNLITGEWRYRYYNRDDYSYAESKMIIKWIQEIVRNGAVELTAQHWS